MPFSKDQLNKFFQSYNEASKTGIRRGGSSQLSRQGEDEELFEVLLDIEELRRPLFAWIIAYIYNYDRSGLKEGLEALRKWSESMRNSWLFMLFLYGRLDDKYSDSHVQDVDSYVKYKKVLRRVSFLKHIYDQNLTLEKTEEELRKFKIIVDRDLFGHPPLMIRKVGKKLFVDFVNQSFQEYLFAEHLLESTFWNKGMMGYTTAPSRNTFLFLEGLIDIILQLGRNLSIGKFMVEGARCWLKTIDDSAEGIKDLRYGLAPNILHFTSARKFMQRVLSNNTLDLGKGSIRDRVDKVVSHYLDSWIRLYILNRLGLTEMTDISKEVLIDLIKIGDFLPGYIKSLNGANLSEADLYGLNLRGAMLMGANLEKSDLRCSILTEANLSSITSLQSEYYSSGKKGQESEKMLPKQQITKLSYANLNYATLERARLEGADISGADLFFTNLFQAILSEVNLSFANLHKSFLNDANLRETTLKGANLSSADLRGADLTKADLFLADFSGANLSNATLSGTNLSNANLSNANLSNVKLEDIKNFKGLICNGADFCNCATINQEGLLKYLEDHGAKNLPRLRSTAALGVLKKEEESSLIINEPSTRKLKKKIDLTDAWNSKSGSKNLGIYYIHQVGETVWWLGQINGNTLNVFRGQIVGDNTIEGEWADVYSEDGKASFKQYKLKLTLDSIKDRISYREENWKESKDVEGRSNANNNFDSIIWQRDKGWIIGIKIKTANKRSIFESQQRQILTGIWSANDGGIYYIYQGEQNDNKIWWFGMHNTDEPNFSNVFCGRIEDDQIKGEWADVPIGKTRNHGNLVLWKVVEVNEGMEEKLYLRRVKETGGFGTTVWERQKIG